MKEVVYTSAAPKPVGPYNQAVKSENLLFLSGQIPVDPVSGKRVAGGIREQARQVFKNIAAVLEEAGSGFDRVVKTTVFLTDLGDFTILNEVYGAYFGSGSAPTRSTVQVVALPLNARVEIDLIAEMA